MLLRKTDSVDVNIVMLAVRLLFENDLTGLPKGLNLAAKLWSFSDDTLVSSSGESRLDSTLPSSKSFRS